MQQITHAAFGCDCNEVEILVNFFKCFEFLKDIGIRISHGTCKRIDQFCPTKMSDLAVWRQ